MEVDSEPEKPTPKPKLRPKAITKGPKGDEDEPARKEQKGAEENGRLMSLLFPADGLSLFQFTVYLSLNVLFTDQTVCLTSDWSCAPCGASHVMLYSEIGVPRSQLAVDQAICHTANERNQHSGGSKKSTPQSQLSAETHFFVLHDFERIEPGDTETFGPLSQFIR